MNAAGVFRPRSTIVTAVSVREVCHSDGVRGLLFICVCVACGVCIVFEMWISVVRHYQ